MKIFKIRDTTTGLFSMGGGSPRWTKKGKTWTNIGHVKSHIRGLDRRYIKNSDHWEVVEYELVETSVGSVSVQSIVDEQARLDREKELERQQAAANRQALKARAINKLSKDEREALGIRV
jgi:hypothetical protein